MLLGMRCLKKPRFLWILWNRDVDNDEGQRYGAVSDLLDLIARNLVPA